MISFSAKLHSQIFHFFRRLRNESRIQNFSTQEVAILDAIMFAGGRLNQKELINSEKMKSSNISAITSKLESFGFIMREYAVDDKRRVCLTLTDKGRFFLEDISAERFGWLDNIIETRLTEKEREVIASAGDLMEKIYHS